VLGATVAVTGAMLAGAALGLAAGDADAAALTVFEDVREAAAPRRVHLRPRPGCETCSPRKVEVV
jgi:hypothetical protein